MHVRTTFQESPRGAEHTRDTGNDLLSPAMARRVTPIPSGCHSPEPRAVRTTNKVADRCTSIAPNPHSRKHNSPTPGRGIRRRSPLAVPCITDVTVITVRGMRSPVPPPPVPTPGPGASDLASQFTRALNEYNATANIAAFRRQLAEIIPTATPDALIAAAEPHRDEPEIIAPVYEAVVAEQPGNARAIVILANAYWLQGRGPQVVGELATKAIAVDPANRGAWHLWALSESDARSRVRRWQQVSERFPEDNLAMAAAADNAASVAGAEKDYDMLDFAIETYEQLLSRTTDTSQREAVSTAISALKGWRF